MPAIRFQLRTLLLAAIGLGCGLGWWFRPYTMEERWPNGRLRSQLRVRRTWHGDVVTNGRQSWWWRNGELARRGESYGELLTKYDLTGKRMMYASGMALRDEELYDEHGRPTNWSAAEFCLLYSFNIAPNKRSWRPNPADRFAETPHE